jgi:hypothetical protein
MLTWAEIVHGGIQTTSTIDPTQIVTGVCTTTDISPTESYTVTPERVDGRTPYTAERAENADSNYDRVPKGDMSPEDRDVHHKTVNLAEGPNKMREAGEDTGTLELGDTQDGNSTTVAELEPEAGKFRPKQDCMHRQENDSKIPNSYDVILPRRRGETTNRKELRSKIIMEEPAKGLDDGREQGQAGAATCDGVTTKELEGGRKASVGVVHEQGREKRRREYNEEKKTAERCTAWTATAQVGRRKHKWMKRMQQRQTERKTLPAGKSLKRMEGHNGREGDPGLPKEIGMIGPG